MSKAINSVAAWLERHAVSDDGTETRSSLWARVYALEARVAELEGALREAASRRCFPLTPRGDAYCDELSREMLDRGPAPELLAAEDVIKNRRCASCIARAALATKPRGGT
jgi:hypothetical protein